MNMNIRRIPDLTIGDVERGHRSMKGQKERFERIHRKPNVRRGSKAA